VVLLFECEACGRRTVAFEGSDQVRCANCGREVSAWSSVPLTIAIGGNVVGDDLGAQAEAPREDHFKLDAAELL
jgi:ribosomal protein L37AE/L43A